MLTIVKNPDVTMKEPVDQISALRFRCSRF